MILYKVTATLRDYIEDCVEWSSQPLGPFLVNPDDHPAIDWSNANRAGDLACDVAGWYALDGNRWSVEDIEVERVET